MLIHQVTGTYLETDNYHDNVNEAVQTWNGDPLQTAKGLLGHLWYLEPVHVLGNTYLIKSYDNKRSLTAGATAQDYPRLQVPDGSPKQVWQLLRPAAGSEQFTIVPQVYPDYALAPQGSNELNNVYVVPVRQWGGVPSLAHLWRAVTPPEK
ncbi:hypothetical protein [Streptosporangium saharense]|uniref:Ricin B lectin domain-containing protein n=1 Tax=Streptosporangium saharense TaxID=1706840 RepID=A0A7W7QJC3_9ACTN|nr:hypothetical protein [Streptosporangium saharense]MBB4914616.1 hypothetical protein [Streptosporangium saharense]